MYPNLGYHDPVYDPPAPADTAPPVGYHDPVYDPPAPSSTIMVAVVAALVALVVVSAMMESRGSD